LQNLRVCNENKENQQPVLRSKTLLNDTSMSSAQPNRRCDETDEDKLAMKARPRDDVYHPESFISCVCGRITHRSVSEGLLNPFSADSRLISAIRARHLWPFNVSLASRRWVHVCPSGLHVLNRVITLAVDGQKLCSRFHFPNSHTWVVSPENNKRHKLIRHIQGNIHEVNTGMGRQAASHVDRTVLRSAHKVCVRIEDFLQSGRPNRDQEKVDYLFPRYALVITA
jgi:hypothetical protein